MAGRTGCIKATNLNDGARWGGWDGGSPPRQDLLQFSQSAVLWPDVWRLPKWMNQVWPVGDGEMYNGKLVVVGVCCFLVVLFW